MGSSQPFTATSELLDRMDLSQPVALGACLPQKRHPQATVPLVGGTANPRWLSPTPPPRAPGGPLDKGAWDPDRGLLSSEEGLLPQDSGGVYPFTDSFPTQAHSFLPVDGRHHIHSVTQDRSPEIFLGPSLSVGHSVPRSLPACLPSL